MIKIFKFVLFCFVLVSLSACSSTRSSRGTQRNFLPFSSSKQTKCCQICHSGTKACGDECIPESQSCRKSSGCACSV